VTDERRCLVIDSHPTVRLGVRHLLDPRYAVEEAHDGDAAMELLSAVGDFDVAIVDIHRRQGFETNAMNGLATIKALRKAHPGLGIVAHAPQAETSAAKEALRAGATAYVAKSSSADSLAQAVDAAADAEPFVDPAAGPRAKVPLTKRQCQIVQLIADGQSTAHIARRLGLSTETVRTHTKSVLARLGARDRAHAVAIALRGGLIA
jgi:DNA-binding NarL/FixJ family response regulator